jgi:GMP synthase-like glutamine amidotransferase
MRVLAAVHEDDAGPGVFTEAANRHGAELVEWFVPRDPAPADALQGYDGAVVLGGSQHPDGEDEHPWLGDEKRLIGDLIERHVPVLGVCLGAELVAEVAGGRAVENPAPHIGWTESALTDAGRDDPVLGALPPSFHCFQWHSYSCEIPSGGVRLAVEDSQLDAFRVGDAWGIQFHAEVDPEIIDGWLDLLETHQDAKDAGFEVVPAREETARRIAASGEVGRTLFGAFLDHLRPRPR